MIIPGDNWFVTLVDADGHEEGQGGRLDGGLHGGRP